MSTIKALIRLTSLWVLQGFCLAVGVANFLALAEWIARSNLLPILVTP